MVFTICACVFRLLDLYFGVVISIYYCFSKIPEEMRAGSYMVVYTERSGSVVECLTRDRRAAGSSLTGVTALWSWSKTHLS